MQYWLYAFKKGEGNIYKRRFNTLERAKNAMDRLDMKNYNRAEIVKIEHGKDYEFICSVGKIGGVKQ